MTKKPKPVTPPRSVRKAATKPPKRTRSQAPLANHTTTTNINQIRRNLLVTRNGELWAWYVLRTVPWAFRSVGERNTHMTVMNQRFAELMGHRVHIRTTAQPFPHARWAERLVETNQVLPDHPMGEPFGGETGYLANAQALIIGSRAYQHTTYVGVRVLVSLPGSHRECVLARVTHDSEPEWAIRAVNQLHKIDEIVGRPGFDAAPVSSRGLAWLTYASLGLGVPVSRESLQGPTDRWTTADVDAFDAHAHVAQEPLSRVLDVVADRDRASHHRYASVLTVGRMGRRVDPDPGVWPWMSFTQGLTDREGLPLPVEWSAHLDIFDGQSKESAANRQVQVAEDQARHYDAHGLSTPPRVQRAVAAAVEVADRRTSGPAEQRVTIRGQFRVAVTADTVSGVNDRVDEVKQAFRSAQYSTEIVREWGQFELYREFIPGFAPTLSGHVREMWGGFAATAVPQATAGLGDGTGPLIGLTSGYGRRPVFFDPNTGPRRNQSGVGAVVAPPGAGKSFFAGVLADACARLGRMVILYDPAGSMGSLARLPHLSGHAREVNLSGAAPGTLNPYRLVPDPSLADYPDVDEYTAAVANAEVERAQLAVNALVGLLADPRPQYVAAVEAAVSGTTKTRGTSLWDVVDALGRDGESGANAAAQLTAAAGLRGGALMFPRTGDRDVDVPVDVTSGLTVITMRDVEIPSGQALDQRERVAHATLRLAARMAQLAMYSTRDPKLIVSDEMGQVGGGNALSASLSRWAMDSRKWNTGLLLLGQNPHHILRLSPEVANLFGWAMVGRMEHPDTARAALDLLGAPQGHGYENTLMTLRTGQFVLRDYDRAIDAVDVVSVSDAVAEALNTTPSGFVDGREVSPGDPYADDLPFAIEGARQ